VDLVARIASHSDGEASLIQPLQKKGKLGKSRLVKGLNEWHRMFDPSWYVMRYISNGLIDC
jgi:hypothetical protein